MSYYIIALEFFLAFWYEKEIFSLNAQNDYSSLLILLVYLCLKFAFYILKKKSRKLMVLSLAIITIFACFSIWPSIILFLPLCITQLILTLQQKWYIALFSLAYVVFLKKIDMDIYLLIGLFCIVTTSALTAMDTLNQSLKAQKQTFMQKQEKFSHQIKAIDQQNKDALYQSKLEQRNALAQKLHDELGHTLSANILKLEAVKLIMDADIEKSKTLTGEVTSSLRSGMDSIRQILKEEKPNSASISIASIKSLISKLNASEQVVISLNYTSDIDALNYEMWSVVYLNIKEALTNMMKYANATTCAISFSKLNKAYRISIIDNGIGCNKIEKGLGLSGMQQRMQAIDGQINFFGSDGFKVIMILKI
jgi:signal transduction histidine kinase